MTTFVTLQEIARHAYYNPVGSAGGMINTGGQLTQQRVQGVGERIRADFLEVVKLQQV